MESTSNPPDLGPYTPTLILHGGAGSISRAKLPPKLYSQYAASLSSYTASTHTLLQSGTPALDAACHAVCLMEDDPLFNCGRGAVFTEAGTNELEASVMVASVEGGEAKFPGNVKRGAGVMLVTGTRHPVLLAREVLLQGDEGVGRSGLGSMHCQRAGKEVEEWGWGRGLERKGPEWFFTRKRWEEHRRGLGVGEQGWQAGVIDAGDDGMDLPSQGTVGAVCMDSWGRLAVATSTGGLTNKKPGRIGDTPTLGAGFWAESWDEGKEEMKAFGLSEVGLKLGPEPEGIIVRTSSLISESLPLLKPVGLSCSEPAVMSSNSEDKVASTSTENPLTFRRAVAMSGTGNGDSFLRTNAARTAAAMCRFGNTHSLIDAIEAVAGPNGEIQKSAGDRWGETGEGEGGIIGIETRDDRKRGQVVSDFNCGGMWRCWIDEKTGMPKVMVFSGEYT